MEFSRAISNLRSSQLQHGVIVQAEKLMIAYGPHAYQEARRRRFQASSAAAARYWLRVKAEIGRRLFERRDDADDFDREEAKPSGFDPASVEPVALGSRDAHPADSVLCAFPSLARRPALADRPAAENGAGPRRARAGPASGGGGHAGGDESRRSRRRPQCAAPDGAAELRRPSGAAVRGRSVFRVRRFPSPLLRGSGSV